MIFHLFGFVERERVSKTEKINRLKSGEAILFKLKEFTENLCKKYGLLKNGKPLIILTRENNPPCLGLIPIDGLLDYHPLEIIRTKEEGIKNCFDFAHFQQYLNYSKYGNGEFPAIDLDKKYYPSNIGWKFAIDILKDNISVIHLNDAFGYKKEGEGIEVGKGEINFKELSPFLKSMKDEIIYTIEIKDGHIHWDKVKRSLEKIKNYDF